jgi:predicted RNA-binding Zn-ribbon protein involved in translation (DUF1610 family)
MAKKNTKSNRKTKNPPKMTAKREVRATGLKTTEKLQHYQCGNCTKWWSIGDADPRKQKWFCPWCGYQQRFINIKK